MTQLNLEVVDAWERKKRKEKKKENEEERGKERLFNMQKLQSFTRF